MTEYYRLKRKDRNVGFKRVVTEYSADGQNWTKNPIRYDCVSSAQDIRPRASSRRKAGRKAKERRGGLSPERYISTDQLPQVQRVLDDAYTRRPSFRTATNLMIFELGLMSGLRAAEMLALKKRDTPARHGKKSLNVACGKGAIARTVEISQYLADKLCWYFRKYRKGSRPGSRLLVQEKRNGSGKIRKMSYETLYRKVRGVGKRAGVRTLTPHVMRHSFACRLFAAERDLTVVQQQLGHARIETTAVYLHTESDEVRRQIERADFWAKGA